MYASTWGVLLAKVFENPARDKRWETLKKLKKDKYQKIYNIIISHSGINE